MNLILYRRDLQPGYTQGELFVAGSIGRLCYTLEDTVREVPGQPVTEWKIPGQTAIPEGIYQVIVRPSHRWGRRMPFLLGVPGFSDIEIHWGNWAEDTEGCILVGVDKRPGMLLQSRVAWLPVYDLIEERLLAGERVDIFVGQEKKPGGEVRATPPPE